MAIIIPYYNENEVSTVRRWHGGIERPCASLERGGERAPLECVQLVYPARARARRNSGWCGRGGGARPSEAQANGAPCGVLLDSSNVKL